MMTNTKHRVQMQAELELCKGSMARLERQLASSEAGKAAAEARLEELAAQVEQLATYPSPASTVPSISRLQKRATAQVRILQSASIHPSFGGHHSSSSSPSWSWLI